jgi:glycosyltransferase involved in cell wall biosynthesis
MAESPMIKSCAAERGFQSEIGYQRSAIEFYTAPCNIASFHRKMMPETMTIESHSQQPPPAMAQPQSSGDSPLRPAQVVVTKVSIVIPVYNEEATIQYLVSLVVNAPMPRGLAREIVIVNDCSKDGTAAKLDQLKSLFPNADIRVTHKPVNQGKGAALRDGFKQATGDVVLVQDADLEYDPKDYPRLLEPIADDKADVVYGSRFIGEPHRVLYFWHTLGNKFLTAFSNMFTNLNLTDMEVCYKVFRRSVLDNIKLKCDRFGFEPEVTAKIAKVRPRLRIYEVGVAYYGRSYEEGKKITWKDGIKAILTIVRFAFSD